MLLFVQNSGAGVFSVRESAPSSNAACEGPGCLLRTFWLLVFYTSAARTILRFVYPLLHISEDWYCLAVYSSQLRLLYLTMSEVQR